MRYADPSKCPNCRGPIGGVPRCAQCGFDLTSPQAQELWNLFLRADQVLGQSVPSTAISSPAAVRADPASGTHDPAAVSSSAGEPGLGARGTIPVATMPRPAPVVAPGAPTLNWSPGAILLGLGALSLVVAATIFISLTWGSLGLAARAAILLALAAAFGVGLWATLRRKLNATSEAISFVVLALVTVNVTAATSEGLFGLNRLHWGYPVLLWAGLILVLSYVIQTFSADHIDRNLIVVEVVLGISLLPAAIAAASFIGTFWPTVAHWSMIAALPILALVLAFAHFSHQRIAWWISLAVTALWVLVMTAWIWVELVDTYRDISFANYGPVLLFIALGIALGVVLSKARSVAWTFAVLNTAFFAAIAAILLLDRTHMDSGISAPLYFFSVFAGVLLLVFWQISTLQTALRWVTPPAIAGLLSLWIQPVGEFLLDRRLDSTRPTDTLVAADFVQVGGIVLATGVLVMFAYLIAIDSKVAAEAGWRATFYAFALLAASLGIGSALSQLHTPVVVLALVVLAGAAGIVYVGKSASTWQFLAVIPTLVPLLLVNEETWPHLVVLVLIGAFSAAAAWWIGVSVHDTPPQNSAPEPAAAAVPASESSTDRLPFAGARYSAASVFAALSSWALIFAAWELPATAGTPLGEPYVYLAIIVGGVIVLALLLADFAQLRLGVVVGAALHALVALSATANQPQQFALVAVLLAAACIIVAVVESHRRAYLIVAILLGSAAWIAQLAAWEIDVVEAYTAPIAAVLIVIGLLAMRQSAALSSWPALAGGLLLSFVPSVLGVLEEPASLRALLFGLTALIVLIAGIYLRWVAPVVIGSVALTLVIMANVGPIILDLDRWILFAGIGAILFAIGIRWEHNVMSGKVLLTRLAQMR